MTHRPLKKLRDTTDFASEFQVEKHGTGIYEAVRKLKEGQIVQLGSDLLLILGPDQSCALGLAQLAVPHHRYDEFCMKCKQIRKQVCVQGSALGPIRLIKILMTQKELLGSIGGAEFIFFHGTVRWSAPRLWGQRLRGPRLHD